MSDKKIRSVGNVDFIDLLTYDLTSSTGFFNAKIKTVEIRQVIRKRRIKNIFK